MGTNKNNGFTVIEIMLFLAVTGALAVAILVGSGVAIGQQRYRDSVNSLKSYIQQQYSEVGNVVNSRNAGWLCSATATVEQASGSAGQARGTSDCVVLGRFVTINESGTKITASNVVGHRVSGSAAATSDIAEIRNYRLSVSPVDQDTVDVSWGAQVVTPKTATPQPLSLLIVKSPLSGSVFTFTKDRIEANLNNLIDVANTTEKRDICVNADAGSFVGKRMEVRIDANATNQSAIQIPIESESICD